MLKWIQMSAVSLLIIHISAHAGLLEQGIVLFEKGKYNEAKKVWQNLADIGDPRAQYNLALLLRKQDSSLSDAQQYLLKSRAQGLVDGYYIEIKPQSEKQAASANTTSAPTAKQSSEASQSDKTPVKTASASDSKKHKESKQSQPEAVVTEPMEWLKKQDKNAYTLQLSTGKSESYLIKMQEKLRKSKVLAQPENLYVHKVESISKSKDSKKASTNTRYILVYGVFDSYQTAKDEISQLPESLQKSSPWIRQFNVLQSIVSNKQL
jgi:septal ring-binding cell division protein DamX